MTVTLRPYSDSFKRICPGRAGTPPQIVPSRRYDWTSERTSFLRTAYLAGSAVAVIANNLGFPQGEIEARINTIGLPSPSCGYHPASLPFFPATRARIAKRRSAE
jgi:hypothetical protein